MSEIDPMRTIDLTETCHSTRDKQTLIWPKVPKHLVEETFRGGAVLGNLCTGTPR